MARVVSLGSINVDRVARVDTTVLDGLSDRYDWFPAPGETAGTARVPPAFERFAGETFPGGKGANQAVAASRAGADVAFLGMVGDDHADFGVLDALADDGVAVDRVAVGSERTGRAYVLLDGTGENRIVSVTGANAGVTVEYVRSSVDVVTDADVLLLQNELPTDPIAWLLDRLGDEPDRPTVVLDPAPATDAAVLLQAPAVDVVTPNEVEYESLSGVLVGFDGTVIRTRGPEPVAVDGAETFTARPPAVDATDPTGAGDTFNGFLATELARGASLRTAVETATVAAALSTRTLGARGAPTREELTAFSG